jgi:esterase/lipase superfamily enzyme
MHRAYHRWHSRALHRDMELLAYGRAGAKVVAFPTSMGRFFDWEERGLVACLAEHLDRGWLQLFCLDSVDAESWYARGRPPAERVRRHQQYDAYILNELLPFARVADAGAFVITAGVSFGGYHAVNFALRHPGAVRRAVGLSGLYDIKQFADGYYDDGVYFNNPCDFIAGEHDPARLALLRRQDIILAVGRDDGLRESNERLSGLLWGKGIGNALRIWDGFAHDWPVWARMLPLYVGGHD